MDYVDEGIASNDSTPDINVKPEVTEVSSFFKDLKNLNGQCVTTTCVSSAADGSESKSLQEDVDFKGLTSDKDCEETHNCSLPKTESDLSEIRSSPPSNDSATADLHLSKEAIDGEVEDLHLSKEAIDGEVEHTYGGNEEIPTDSSVNHIPENKDLLTIDIDTNVIGHNCLPNSNGTHVTHSNISKISENGPKVPFRIEEMRNSLKNVLDKCKLVSKTKPGHSELSKEEIAIYDSSIHHDNIEKCDVKTHKDIEPAPKVKKIDYTDSELDDELLTADDDDGIAMVIGSDNEDALLDLSGDSEDNNCSLSQEDVKDDLLSDADIFKETCSEVSKSESGLDKIGSGNEDALIELSGNSDANNYSLSQDDVKEFLVNDKDIKNACSEVRKSESGVEVIDVSKNKLNNDKFNEESLTSSNVTNLNHKCSETLYLDKDNCQQSNESNASEDKCGPGSVCDSSDELNDTKPDAIEIHLSEKQCAVETNEACTKVNMIENNKNTDTTCEAQNIDSTENKFVLSEEDEDDDVIFEGESRLSTDNKALNCLKDVSKTNDSKEQKFSELQNVSGTENVPNGELTHEEDLHNQRFSKEVVCKNGRMDADSNVIDGKEVKSINAPSDKEPEFAFDNELLHKSYSNIEEATSSIVDRKRPANFENSQEHSYKRSKLENAEALSDKANNLGNLSQNLGTHNEPVEVSDSDNEETGDELTTDTAQESDVEMATSKKLITMTEEELDKLVREKVKAYMLSEEKTLVGKLTAKVKELQQNNDQWKRKVKDLQVKVNDVTIVQQKMEKRKAATAALRQITTRNVAVQVEDGKTAYAKPLKPVTPATQRMPAPGSSPLTGQGTIRLPIPNSALAKPVGSLGPSPSAMINVSTNIDTPTVKTLLDTTRVQRTVGSAPLTTTTTSSQVINLVQYPSSMPVIRPAISQGLVSIPTQATLLAQPLSSPVGNPTSKVIDLTDDDDGSKLRLVASQGLITSPFVAQGIRQVLASPGTQIVSPVGQPMSGYQLLVASTTGMRQTMASHLTTTYVTTGGPPGLVSLQPMGQVTQGTLMARAATPATPNVAPLLRLASMPTHPAPFPPLPINQLTMGLKLLPPKPTLRISRGGQGIVLSWNMHLTSDLAVIASYQLFAYQETSAPPTPNLWKKVGEVKALALPMACTLTQFQVGNKYHFAVRALDVHQRVGNFSDPGSIHLTAVAPTSK